MEKKISFTVNGRPTTVTTDSERPLLEVLREDLQLTGTKYGCGEGKCGACTVLIEGKTVVSCITPVEKVDNQSIQTIEGLASGGKLHAVQEAFLDEHAYQCGYCTPGMVLATVALLNERPDPSDAEIHSKLEGHICRCCGYPRLIKAVKRAAANTNAGRK